MNVDKRIWKTGTLAVAATIVFSMLVFQAAEDDPGETTVDGANVKVIPQIVAGSYDGGLSKYSTVIQVLNTSTSIIDVRGNFYNTLGAPTTLEMSANGAAFTGTLASTPLAPNAMLVISTSSPSGEATSWGRIVTSGSTSISAYYELRDGTTNALYNRVGVAASDTDMSAFVIPRIRNALTGLDVGFAIVNTGMSEADITGTVRDANGTVLATRVHSMAAGAHTANFTREFFNRSCSPCLVMDSPGLNYSSVTFSSPSAQFAAVALGIEGASMSSFPVDALQ